MDSKEKRKMKENYIKECMLDKDNIVICVISLMDSNPLLVYISKTMKINTMIGQRFVNDVIEGIKL